MKGLNVALFLVISLSLVSAEIWGIDYTAKRNKTASCPTYDQVYQDLVLLKPFTNRIRIYNMQDCNQGNYTVRAAQQLGMKVFIGFQNDPLDMVYYQLYILQWLEDNYQVHDTIIGASVGTESIWRNDLPVATVVQRIALVKNWTRDYGFTFPIGYADTTSAIQKNTVLATVCDMVLINIFPIYQGGTISSASDSSTEDILVKMVRDTQKIYASTNTDVWIGETGWSTYDVKAGNSTFTTLTWFVQNMACRTFTEKIPMFWFEAFNQEFKSGREAQWGLFNNNRTLKTTPNFHCANAPSTFTQSTYTVSPISTNVAADCQAMFSALTCKTFSENIYQVNATIVGQTTSYLCTYYPQYCTAIRGVGAKYAHCNAVEKVSYVMDQYYTQYSYTQGDDACYFNGIGQIHSASTPEACHDMYKLAQCRTSAENPSGLGSSVQNTLDYLCSHYPQYCAPLNASTSPYFRCNLTQKATYAMNKYYNDFVYTQGNSACNFNGLGVLNLPAANQTLCHQVYTSSSCRTASENATKVDVTAVGDALSFVCSNNPELCTDLRGYNGPYSQCSITQKASYAMDRYYSTYYSTLGDAACDFNGVGNIQRATPYDADLCSGMYDSLSCRTTSRDTNQVNATQAGLTLAFICSELGAQVCSPLSGVNGKYASCSTAEKASYAMSAYYDKYAKILGDSTCDFSGLGTIHRSIPYNATDCQTVYDRAQCRTTSSDVSALNGTQVGDILNYVCSNYPAYCTDLYGADGRYAQCSVTQQATWVMNQYYNDNFAAAGDAACYFDGIGKIQWSVVSNSTVCHGMYNSLDCHTTSEDPAAMNGTTVGLALEYICSNNPTLCTLLNSDGPYTSCNTLQRASFAMNQYYLKNYGTQGNEACYFGGIGQVLVEPVKTSSTVGVITQGGQGENNIVGGGVTRAVSFVAVLFAVMLTATRNIGGTRSSCHKSGHPFVRLLVLNQLNFGLHWYMPRSNI
ncbi:glucan beta-glucosidase Bgl2 (predicted) [Planoprotostelium fungivorum]|uniref:glucan endo-1,3-beta-D-glucosidase n=1 Tax=Planoprotostelium fungivorum TaxID=1890364 RepID=A0A2P6MTQ9_9EUKA|nr:glucan beta-glucosidase Bgl2 (predicted) [Planoprotostelium fungivorum]